MKKNIILLGLILMCSFTYADEKLKNSIRTNIFGHAIGIQSIEFERAINEKVSLSLDYWYWDISSDTEDFDFGEEYLKSVRLMYKYYPTSVLAGGFVGIGMSQLKYYEEGTTDSFGSSPDTNELYYGVDLKLGYNADIAKHLSLGFQAGVTLYSEDVLVNGMSSDDSADYSSYIPNVGMTLAIRM